MAKKKKTTTTKTKKEEKQILLDLVESSDLKLTSVVMDLSRADLLDQYYEEREARAKGIPITSSITQKEFDKLMEE